MTGRPKYKLVNGGASWDDIGAELGISRARVQYIYKRAVKKVLRACRKYGVRPGDVLEPPVHALADAERWS